MNKARSLKFTDDELMNDQISLFETEGTQNCWGCRYFSALKSARPLGGGAIIYGYCFKDNYNMGKGYAVYLPDSDACKSYQPKQKM